MIRVWYEADAIQMDGVGAVPARSLKAVVDGDRVHVLTLSDVRLSQLLYGEYLRKDGSGFTSAAAVKTYLDAEFAKAPTAITPTTPARVIGTAFQPNASKAVLVSYAVKAQVTNPAVVGTSTTTVRLLSDANNPPTTVRDVVEATSGVGVSVTLALTTSNTAALRYLVPAGHWVLLQQAIVGTGTASVVAQVEEALG